MNGQRGSWDQRYRGNGPIPPPARVLRDFAYRLPARGVALDLACGLGGNALELARCGLTTSARDLSPVALERLQQAAVSEGLEVQTRACDLVSEALPQSRFDVIVVTRFLERALCPAIAAALRPGGLLYYQTFTGTASGGPRNPAYRLASGELLSLFSDLQALDHRPEMAGEAALVARDRR